MQKLVSVIILALLSSLSVSADLTLDECVKKAQNNYPLIRKYDLLSQLKEVDLSDINKTWLPKLSLYAQVSGQNVVPSFPSTLSGVLEQMGQQVKGLGKIHYKGGLDVSQMIWDGGLSVVKREIIRMQDELHRSSLDLELYTVKQRVENIFFAILLTDEQIAQNQITLDLLRNNLDKVRSMMENGTAMQSDVDMLEAQSLSIHQGMTMARSAVNGYRDVLSILMGEDIGNIPLSRPVAVEPIINVNNRLELKLFENRKNLNALNNRISEITRMPKIGLFAQVYYGYPGFDYFQSMMNRNLSFNILAGIEASWNLDSFYTRKNSKRRTSINACDIEEERDLFLYNSDIQAASQRERITGLQNSMKEDSKIIELRIRVRKAAEIQLENGVIDATALLQKIADENIAQLTARYHEIQLVQAIYNLKYLLNQ